MPLIFYFINNSPPAKIKVTVTMQKFNVNYSVTVTMQKFNVN